MATEVSEVAVTTLSGVGPQIEKHLQRLGITTVSDILFHLPLRYENRNRHLSLGSVRTGDVVTIIGKIDLAQVVFGRRRSLVCRMSDGTGSLTIRLFHFNKRQQQGFERGRWISCYGEVRIGRSGKEMIHPEYKISSQPIQPPAGESLTAVYPTTQGLGQPGFRRLVKGALSYVGQLSDLLPDGDDLPFGPLSEAVRFVHAPPLDADLAALTAGDHPAQQRLAIEELLAHHLSFKKIRQRRENRGAPSLSTQGAVLAALRTEFGFSLTAAQERVINEVMENLNSQKPTLRLVQGDVGSGKTVIAAAAAAQAVESGYQVAIMAPTELLAEQHLLAFRSWFRPLGIEVAWLTGRLPASERKGVIQGLSQGSVKLVVGTHALFQQEVVFLNLGLVVVDEQHRFGVGQRLALVAKGGSSGLSPHQLTMTATPIPRTLAMTFYADLDISSIDELPPGRQTVTTVALPESRRQEVVERVRHACRGGHQAYWVCPLIEESELLLAQSATATEAEIRQAFPELKIGLVHGRMSSAEKEAAMRAFRLGETNLLVATTVIEVGVDVPNASLMIIENAERLGLSQIHQLRGRVGRGTTKASCVMIYRSPLGEQARQRLDTLRSTTDGFVIAEKDLEQRGGGELMGTRQTGHLRMRIADLVRDQQLLSLVEKRGRVIMRDHPEWGNKLIHRWLGEKEQFGAV